MQAGRISKKILQRDKLIIAMLQHPTLEKAAAAAEMSATTAWRISKTLEFQEEYRRARREAYSQSIGRLQQGSTAAATTLMKVMVDPGASAECKVRAADCTLWYAAKGIETEDLLPRVDALEAAKRGSKD